MDDARRAHIKARIDARERPGRIALSRRFPFLVPVVTTIRRTARAAKNTVILGRRLPQQEPLPCVITRHSSPLFRKLTDDATLDENKVQNLRMAISRINGTVIQPGQTFSLWKQLGRVTRRKGYVDGMLLSDGKVVRGLGGGLCQLSNLLHWMFLHADTTITERYHHSVDAFPDSGRTIPFGSGATIFDNYIDLQMRNMSPHPLQICLSLTDTQLKGQLRSTHHKKYSYHVREAFHCFVRSHHRWYRYNTLERDVLSHGKIIDTHTVCENLAPVAYAVDTAYLAQYLTLDLDNTAPHA